MQRFRNQSRLPADSLKDLERDIGLDGVQLETSCADLADHGAEREALRLLSQGVKSALD